MKIISRLLAALTCVAALGTQAHAGKIVVANDEWTLSNTGFSGPNDPGVFATNVAQWFTGGPTGSFLAYSSNFGLNDSSLQSAMTGAGHSWLVSTNSSLFTAINLATYDGIFLGGSLPAGTPANYASILTSYVNAGGNVYVMGGTGNGGAAAEAAFWNPFLNNFGLGFDTTYNNVGGDIAISNPHPIFTGVDHLFQNNGQDTLDINASSSSQVVLVSSGGHGLYAVYDSSAVPEPGSLALLGLGLGLAGLARSRRTRQV